VTLVLP